MNSSARRRRRIAVVVALPLLAALAVGWLESGNWLVVYNDTARPLAAVEVQCGTDRWTLRELEPRASRRVRLPHPETAAVVVAVADWAAETAYPISCDWRETTTVTVRLQDPEIVTWSGAGSFVSRLLRW